MKAIAAGKLSMAMFVAAVLGCAAGSQRVSSTTGAPGELPATSTLRLSVINLTGRPTPFLFRLGGIQILDTIAPPGSLPVPVLSRSLQVAPGRYQLQLYGRESRKLAQDSLDAGHNGSTHATVELIFEETGARMTLCYCVRVYGTGTPSP